MFQGLEALDTSSGKLDCLDLFLNLCAILCFFRGVVPTGVWQASGIDRSTPRTTRFAWVGRCPRENSSPNSLAVPPHSPKIASSTAPFGLQRLDCQILWREKINWLRWYIPSQLRPKAHRCRWSKQCAQTCEGWLLRHPAVKQLQKRSAFHYSRELFELVLRNWHGSRKFLSNKNDTVRDMEFIHTFSPCSLKALLVPP